MKAFGQSLRLWLTFNGESLGIILGLGVAAIFGAVILLIAMPIGGGPRLFGVVEAFGFQPSEEGGRMLVTVRVDGQLRTLGMPDRVACGRGNRIALVYRRYLLWQRLKVDGRASPICVRV